MVVDGADNCAYPVYEIADEDFSLIFPGEGQDVEFNSDLEARLGTEGVIQLHQRIWEKPVEKKDIQGLHGTIFYGLDDKKKYYPSKRESEMVVVL